jgi:mRNA interferase RelE/StbE
LGGLHQVGLTKQARADLAGIPEPFNQQIAKHLRALAENPFPSGVKKLKGVAKPPRYRVRSGNYRILFTVGGDVVVVYSIGDRKDVYR